MAKLKVEVLGSGCSKCKFLEKRVREVVAEKEIDADVVKVTDLNKITDYGVMMTPAIVVNGVVKCYGRIPSKEEIEGWIGGA